MNFYLYILMLLFSIQMLANNNIDVFLEKENKVFEEIVLKDKIVVQFVSGLSVAEKEKLFKQYNFLNPYYAKMEPAENDVALVNLQTSVKNYEELKKLMERLKQDKSIKTVHPVVSDFKNHPVLILNPVSFSIRKTVSIVEIQKILKQFGIQEISESSFVKNVLQFEVPKSADYNILEIVAYLHQSGLVNFAEPNYGFFVDACTNDQFYNRQWNIKNDGTPLQGNGAPGADMDVDSAWSISTGSPFIKIAILDSGVDTLHPDLIDNLLPGYDATGSGSFGYPHARFTKDGHGTACAGIAAALGNNNIGIAGVAYDCRIVPIKIFYYVDSILPSVEPYSEALWMASAISWAWQNADVDVMSNSWGLPDLFIQLLPGNPALVDSAIHQAYKFGRNGKGIPQFFSSGNEGNAPIWPSRLNETFAVNATNMCDFRKDSIVCDNENWEGNWGGNSLDVGAPGVKITTTDMLGTKGFNTSITGDYYFSFNGTSAACPNAAAVAALILSVRSDIYVEDVRFILGSSADKVGGYDYSTIKLAGNWSQELGYGRVNAYKALQLADTYSGNLGINNTASINHLVKVHPNPASEELRVHSLEFRIEKVVMIDIMGKQLIDMHMNHLENEINISHLPLGIYFCNIFLANGQQIVKRVVKE
jgi:subtilisin family serine protease